MALLPCPECQKQVSDQASACPSCGLPLGRKALRRRLAVLGGVVVLALAAGGLFAALRPPD